MTHPQTMLASRIDLVTIAGAAVLGGAVAGSAYASDAAMPAAVPVTALHCGHFVDTAAGKVLGETTIVVEGARVLDVKSGTQTPARRSRNRLDEPDVHAGPDR